jgi:WD40 repeat protein
VFDAKTGGQVQNYADPAGNSGQITSLAWSPDNRYLAASNVPDETTFLGTTTTVFEAHTGKVVATHPGIITAPHCNWSPNGKYLVTGDTTSDGDSTEIWSAQSGQNIHSIPDTGNPCYSPNGTRIAVVSTSGGVQLWDTATWKLAANFQGRNASQTYQLSWSPDGTRIISANLVDDTNHVGASVEVWNAKTGNTIVTYRFPYQTYQSDNKTYSYQLSDAEWSPNGQSVATLFINTVKIQPGNAG